MDSSTSTLWTGTFPVEGVPVRFLLLPLYTEISAFNANGVDPDQTPRRAAPDLGLQCLLLSLLWDKGHKWDIQIFRYLTYICLNHENIPI